MLLFETFVKIGSGSMFAVRVAVAHWLDRRISREQAVEQAAEAIAKHMRESGQSADGLTRADIAFALYARDYYNAGHAPAWFECSDEPQDLAEDIGSVVLERLATPVAA